MDQITICGSLPAILYNDEKIYQGDLTYYFRIIWENAKNLGNPYHNLRHMFHVLWLCFRACIFYKDKLTPRQMRNLLIGALFHDFNHPGKAGDDRLNIERAIRGLKKYILPEDRPYFKDICAIIRATEFPYKVSSETLSLSCKIIRDADLAQVLDVVWLQQVVVGLAKEWGKEPIEVLKDQDRFLSNLKFNTKWAQTEFPPDAIARKITEAQRLLGLFHP